MFIHNCPSVSLSLSLFVSKLLFLVGGKGKRKMSSHLPHREIATLTVHVFFLREDRKSLWFSTVYAVTHLTVAACISCALYRVFFSSNPDLRVSHF